MINYKELVKKTGIVSLADVFIKLRPFIIIPIISKGFGAQVYGVWAQIMVTVTMLLPVVLLGLSFGLMRYLPGRTQEETREDFSSIFIFVTVASIIGAILLVLMSSFLSREFFGSTQFSQLIRISSLYLITMALREIVLSYFLAKDKQFIYSTAVICESLLSIVAILLFISAGSGIKSILITLTAMNSLLILYCFLVVHKDISLIFPAFRNARIYLKFSLPLVPSFLLLWVINSSDRYFLGYFKDMESVGIYSACYGISYFVIFALMGPLYIVLEPRINNAWNSKKYDLAKKLLNNSIKYTFFIALPSAILFYNIADPVLIWFTSPEFISGIKIVPLILAGYFLYLVAMIMRTITQLAENTIRLVFIYSVTAIINVLLNLVLIPRLGMYGAAISTFISFLCFFILLFISIRSKRLLELDAAFFLKVSICAVAAGIIVSLLPRSNFAWVILDIALFGIAYLCLVIITGVFDRQSLKKIREDFAGTPDRG